MLEHIRSTEAALSRAAELAAPPLISYVLRGLDSCWMPDLRRWSHIHHLDGRAHPNQSIPHSDVVATLNVLLGLSRIEHLGRIHRYDLRAIFAENVVKVGRLPSRKYAYGMALWAGAELDLHLPAETYGKTRAILDDKAGWMTFEAQDLAMLLLGCIEQARRGRPDLGVMARDLFRFLDRYFTCPSGLFYDGTTGWRRRFSSFAAQSVLTLACFAYGEWARDQRALRLAKACSAKLIALQGPQGEWPCHFYTPAARVVDFYEVSAVHQGGMAPAWLEYAERHGVAGAEDALVKGFMWILGNNQRQKSMLWREKGLICRSHIRKGEGGGKSKRAMRALFNAVTGGGQALISPDKVDLRLECSSRHLGWVLWSFGQRDDLDAIQYHASLS